MIRIKSISIREDFDLNALTDEINAHIEKERREAHLREQIKRCGMTPWNSEAEYECVREGLSVLVTELLKLENTQSD